jgi:hypothetical protein
VHCTTDDFDADSHVLTVNNYIDLYFDKNEKNQISLYGTDKWWSYKIEKQYGSWNKYQIVLTDDEERKITLRGDTLGTYKSILQYQIHGKKSMISKEKLEQIENLDLSELSFCHCEKRQVYNNHTIGSFFIIPKADKPYASLNISRAKAPYYDNFYMYLQLVKKYCIEKTCDDESMKSLFKDTEDFWKLFEGNEGFNKYIECMCFGPFVDNIPEKLKTSPIQWEVDIVNDYFKSINNNIAQRNITLYERYNKINLKSYSDTLRCNN